MLKYSQPPASFGGFTTKLNIHYVVSGPDGRLIVDEEVSAQGVDDTGATAGIQRAARAKTLALANNVYDFRTLLEGSLLAYSRREHPRFLVARKQLLAPPALSTPAGFEDGEALVPIEDLALLSDEPIEHGDFYALVIGNNQYANLPSLLTAVNDAAAVSKLLREAYGYEVTTLIDASDRTSWQRWPDCDANSAPLTTYCSTTQDTAGSTKAHAVAIGCRSMQERTTPPTGSLPPTSPTPYEP